eukprot:scaffold39246_cov59-Phaeocystis_antarctica.AAC.4
MDQWHRLDVQVHAAVDVHAAVAIEVRLVGREGQHLVGLGDSGSKVARHEGERLCRVDEGLLPPTRRPIEGVRDARRDKVGGAVQQPWD